jgi:hypothetical protein
VIEGFDDYDWVTAQVNRRERYLDRLRDMVRAGRMKLDAALAKMLGMRFDDGVELVPRAGTGTLAYGKSVDPYALATAKRLRDEAMRLIAPTAHRDWCSLGHPADEPCGY